MDVRLGEARLERGLDDEEWGIISEKGSESRAIRDERELVKDKRRRSQLLLIKISLGINAHQLDVA